LKELLAVERGRLQVALQIEKDRKIVFPETTVIIRDIERLTLEIEKRELPDTRLAPPKKRGGLVENAIGWEELG
jgi:hypothetical protein